jgi:indole-3-glycerol phosphate synthase
LNDDKLANEDSDFLTRIMLRRRESFAATSRSLDVERLREAADSQRSQRAPHRLRHALNRDRGINIIAEFKRASPSKGIISEGAEPAHIAADYVAGGASAISVLTEEDFFRGSLDDLRAIRKEVALPVLRKDFIFDELQILEAAEAGADAVLLIVRALEDQGTRRAAPVH